MPADNRPSWHAESVEQALDALEATPRGLTQSEAERRLEQFGRNEVRKQQKATIWDRIRRQLANALIMVLIASAVLAALLGAWLDSLVIIAVVAINTIIGLVQEGKAERALESIRGMLAPKAYVTRDGERFQVNAAELVPGDIALLQSGDRVPADLRLIEMHSLQIDEAVLTGESVTVQKQTGPVPEDAELGDRLCMAYSGTVITSGTAKGLVVATGMDTEIGRISEMLAEVEQIKTPLLQKMDVFGKWLSIIIIAVAALMFVIGYFVWEYTLLEMILASVSLIVGAIPEGLPPIMTITLALGVQRMAKRNAIVRRLPAVETLGSVTVICSDKTGTLTRNEMTLKTIRLRDAEFEVEGVGYDPHGAFCHDGKPIEPEEQKILMQMLRAGLLCNDSALRSKNGQWQIEGDPTEGGLIVAARKAGLEQHRENDHQPRRDVIPFESDHRFMATLHHDHAGFNIIYVKGAPDRLFDMCSKEQHGDEQQPFDREWWEQRINEITSRGQRTLGIAYRTVNESQNQLDFDDVQQDLVWLGLLGIIDPPREDAIRSVADCHSAGIEVKMITGDHAGTARAIAEEMKIGGDKCEAITGRELDAMGDEELARISIECDVFARCSPGHKLRLVQALQQQQHLVAVTGDGVNDAPALKRADIGVAMGQKGSDAAKEAADMVLADDNFTSVARAVEEGRTIYDNLRKALVYILPTSGGQALTVFLAVAFGLTLPLRPVHILWVNMVTAVTLAMSLAFEPKEDDVMARPPRPPDTPLITPLLLWRIVFVSILLVAGTFGHFYYAFETLGHSLEVARTAAVNTLVAGQVFYLFNCRKMILATWNMDGLFGNRIVWFAIGVLVVLQAGFTYWAPAQVLFESTPIGLDAWARIVAFCMLLYVLVEFEKIVLRRRGLKSFE